MKFVLSLLVSVAFFSYISANNTENLPECTINDDCAGDRVCSKGRVCVDPCVSVCSNNTVCHVTNHVAMCSCSPGYSGHPALGCSLINIPECVANDGCSKDKVCNNNTCVDPCVSVCGANTVCHVADHVAMCSCSLGYYGDPATGCSLTVDNQHQNVSQAVSTSNNYFTCSNGDRVPKNWVCDGVSDCIDGSDELSCHPDGCNVNEFRCDNKRCIPNRWRCQSTNDCDDGSDERNCEPRRPDSKGCKNNHRCGNGECVPQYWKCDGYNDCRDGSDERNCGLHRELETCIQPEQVGNCTNYSARWYYDIMQEQCRQFYYGGCGGNRNNFQTEEECRQTCDPYF